MRLFKPSKERNDERSIQMVPRFAQRAAFFRRSFKAGICIIGYSTDPYANTLLVGTSYDQVFAVLVCLKTGGFTEQFKVVGGDIGSHQQYRRRNDDVLAILPKLWCIGEYLTQRLTMRCSGRTHSRMILPLNSTANLCKPVHRLHDYTPK